MPAHAALVGGDLFERRLRDDGERDIVMVEMHQRAVEVIGEEGAAGASRLPIRPEHEMIDDELAAVAEEIGEAFAPFGRIETVVLVNLDPGQRPALRIQAIARPGVFLFSRQQRAARLQPLLARYHGIFHVDLLRCSSCVPVD